VCASPLPQEGAEAEAEAPPQRRSLVDTMVGWVSGIFAPPGAEAEGAAPAPAPAIGLQTHGQAAVV
jgi:hypothetical protein